MRLRQLLFDLNNLDGLKSILDNYIKKIEYHQDHIKNLQKDIREIKKLIKRLKDKEVEDKE